LPVWSGPPMPASPEQRPSTQLPRSS
jgi:hypothetical protein